MMYIPALITAFALGYLTIRFLVPKLNHALTIALSLALGFGIVGHIGFYVHIVMNQFTNWITPVVSLIAVFILFARLGKKLGTSTDFARKLNLSSKSVDVPNLIGIGVLIVLGIPMIATALNYPLGGWDAWSCWNLKAKFIYLGQENWKNMLDPALWRSNTHYPLLLPLINVWFWQWSGAQEWVLMANTLVLNFTIMGVLYWGMVQLGVRPLHAGVSTVLAFALPFNLMLNISQYSDLLLGLYCLSAMVCLLMADQNKDAGLKSLAMVFLGFLSFTKTEGLVAAGILFLLHLWIEQKNKKQWPSYFKFFSIAALPTIIFTLFIAPKNAAFINGLSSSTHASDFSRLQIIAIYPFIEMIGLKWNGLWVMALGGLILAGKSAWQGRLKMAGLFVGAYLLIVCAYYFLNTFFPIVWWLQTTFHRIIAALIPVIVLWVLKSLKDA